MNSHLVLKSVVFIVEGLLLMLALAAAVHFEIGRLLLAIAVGAVCAFARDLRDRIKIGQSLWKWSGRITSRLVRRQHCSGSNPNGANRGEA